jgi:hypothetical protein
MHKIRFLPAFETSSSRCNFHNVSVWALLHSGRSHDLGIHGLMDGVFQGLSPVFGFPIPLQHDLLYHQ